MNRLAELRKAAGYTQKYVALELGVKAPSVCAWEKGDGNPKQENLIALAKLYGVSVDYLLGNDKQEGEPEGEPAEDKSSANRRALHEIIDKFSDEDIPDVINHLKALEIVCQHKKETK
jgi:transcriptional regulator with XRE-family HTH domain|uniref:Helix-turn-helix domain protein n=1 Tax=Siphoviridae sp. ctS1E53 TaxID=2826340 RepID=A0A8S5MEV1_9CAUD|nr:MAG TPA: helix-turn-helix domain protein [Siphoviridae sp. ctS1E53]